MMHTQHDSSGGNFLTSRGGLVLLGFLAIAGFYLITEHTAHVFGALPFLLILACPLMHVFMHGGHGNDDSHAGHTSGVRKDGEADDER